MNKGVKQDENSLKMGEKPSVYEVVDGGREFLLYMSNLKTMCHYEVLKVDKSGKVPICERSRYGLISRIDRIDSELKGFNIEEFGFSSRAAFAELSEDPEYELKPAEPPIEDRV